MRHPFFAAARPLVFAHRGGSALAPENTLQAFDNGLRLGADGLELDVHRSCDGAVVVHHDRTLDRTTALRGPIARRTAEELKRAGVPALDEVLRRYPDVRIIIELKVNRAELAAAALDVVQRAGALGRVCFGAFGYRVLRAVRTRAPAAATSASRLEARWALYRSRLRWPVSRVSYGGLLVPECSGLTRVVSPWFIECAHRSGLAVHVWTVDSEARAALARDRSRHSRQA
jgi:glycerophosphoryl diester phosphodiesterase